MTAAPLIFTGGAATSGVEPILAALRAQDSQFVLVDTLVDGVTITHRDDGADLDINDTSRVVMGRDSRVLLWRPTTPSSGVRLVDDEDIVRFARRSESVAWRALLSRPAMWINRDSCRRMFEHDQLLPSRLARANGLATIPTVLTNSPSEFLHAVEHFNNDVAVKAPISWHRIASDGETVATYTQRVRGGLAQQLAPLVSGAPVYVQPYMAKLYELRVTVIADTLFACRIDSQASEISMTDWRHYDLGNVSHDPVELGERLSAALVGLVASCGLIYAAIDLIVQPGGEVVFVELNPSGHYAWIEALTGMPISASIAGHLMGSLLG